MRQKEHLFIIFVFLLLINISGNYLELNRGEKTIIKKEGNA
jgi:hypothetical protein